MASKIASRSVEIEYTEVKVPSTPDSFITKFRSATGISTGLSNQKMIHVLPNFMSIFLFCAYHANEYIGFLEPRNHAKISAATLTLYFLNLVYAHFLINDIYIYSQPSPYADSIMNENYSQSYVYYLLNLPVPEFLEPIIKYFTATSSSRRPNIVFRPSFAGYSHFHHYGKVFPLNILSNVHDLASSVSGRSDPNVINVELLTTLVYRVSTVDISTGMLFASLVPESSTTQADLTYLDNKPNQVFKALFNPVLLRALQMKQTFAPINLTPFKSETFSYNPYRAMMCINRKNVSELQTLLSSIASLFKGVIKCNGDLASMYKTQSGITILNHGYSHYALPTSHYNTLKYNDTYMKRVRPLSPSDYAQLIRFKQTPDQTTLSKQNFELPECSVDPSHDLTVPTPHSILLENTDFPKKSSSHLPSPRMFIKYDDRRDLYPRVMVFNHTELDTISAYLTTLCGMIIESEELEGSLVLQPNPDAHIGVENSLFSQSAIQLAHITPTTFFSVHTATPTYPQIRDTIRQDQPPAVSMLRSSSMVPIPYLTKGSRFDRLNELYYGLAPVLHVTWPEKFQTFLGFKLNDNSNRPHSKPVNEPIRTPPFDTLVWSPYTYIAASYEFDVPNTEYNDNLKNIVMLVNFRTLFGSDVTLDEVAHPFEAMPIS